MLEQRNDFRLVCTTMMGWPHKVDAFRNGTFCPYYIYVRTVGIGDPDLIEPARSSEFVERQLPCCQFGILDCESEGQQKL
eukprot:scaffold5529_cov117-Cylindrotheca_fusiformis.AAC.9